jgi:hypothetical protein
VEPAEPGNRVITRSSSPQASAVNVYLVGSALMGNFIATVSTKAPGNWEICKREGLWGVIERHGSATGVANAERVAAGDCIFIWLGKRGRSSPGGVIA